MAGDGVGGIPDGMNGVASRERPRSSGCGREQAAGWCALEGGFLVRASE